MQIVDKSLCSGCSACLHICPKNSISMEPDKNGFLCPTIDESKCIDCGLCKKTCPVLNKKEQVEKKLDAYAVINKDEIVRKESSSGGVFNSLARYVLNKNGVVFGALFDENFKVKHAYIENESGLIKLQKSKYVQSEIGVTYKEVKTFLGEGRLVLFTGTPCQIGGLQAYLKKDYDNLITQDFICHGVPSPKVWEKYIEKKQLKGKIKEVSFKDKRTGWNKYSITFEHNSNTDSELARNNHYMLLFLKDVILRQSCYNCAFKDKYRNSDITLADYWGVENVHTQFSDDKGTSLVVLNSKKGKDVFNEIKQDFIYEPTDLERAISYNTCMIKSVNANKNREDFFKRLDKCDVEKLAKKYTQKSKIKIFINRLKSFIKRKIKGVNK